MEPQNGYGGGKRCTFRRFCKTFSEISKKFFIKVNALPAYGAKSASPCTEDSLQISLTYVQTVHTAKHRFTTSEFYELLPQVCVRFIVVASMTPN